MNLDKAQEVDGTQPSEGGSIVINHNDEQQNSLPEAPINPTNFVDGGLKPFSNDLIKDAPIAPRDGQPIDDSKSIFSNDQSAYTNIQTTNSTQSAGTKNIANNDDKLNYSQQHNSNNTAPKHQDNNKTFKVIVASILIIGVISIVCLIIALLWFY